MISQWPRLEWQSHEEITLIPALILPVDPLTRPMAVFVGTITASATETKVNQQTEIRIMKTLMQPPHAGNRPYTSSSVLRCHAPWTSCANPGAQSRLPAVFNEVSLVGLKMSQNVRQITWLFVWPAVLRGRGSACGYGNQSGRILADFTRRSSWIPGSYETSSSRSAPSNALPRWRTLCTNSKDSR
jgi:hypothetical protein